MRRDEYLEYLKSAEWLAKKREIWRRQGGKCANCSRPMVHTHHKTYERIGNESLDDLEGLCSECHKFRHGIVELDPASMAYSEWYLERYFSGESTEQSEIARPLVLDFGKFKGQPLSTIPTSYLKWVLAECYLRDDLRAGVVAEIERRRSDGS